MMRAAYLAVAMGLCLAAAPALARNDRVVMVQGDDPVMNAAIAKARDSLPAFWDERDHPGAAETDFTLKIRVEDKDGIEFFWCDQIEGTAEASTCAIANDPEIVKSVTFGQRIPVTPAAISDWMYMREGKIVGGETIRVLLPQLSKEEADAMRAMLAD